MMEEISPHTRGLSDPLFASSAIPAPPDEVIEDKGESDILVKVSNEDEILEDATPLTSVELLPLDPTLNISVPIDPTLETSLPIAVEIDGTNDGEILAKVISLEDRSIKRKLSEDVVKASDADMGGECSSGTKIKASVIAVKLSDEKELGKVNVKSVFELDCLPLWGSMAICGHRSEMEDALVAVPNFMKIPIRMFIGNDDAVNGISKSLSHLTSHFFGVYDGHGGSEVADYCRDHIHHVLEKELTDVKEHLVKEATRDTRHLQWENVFTRCFSKVDDEVIGKEGSLLVIPDTVGSTAVVAVVCSSHIVVANCGDSRAVLYRGKEAIPLSNDHKPSREDECARIEESGGKVIQWNGHRVFGVLAMSRSIGDRYLKPWIIPTPEVIFLPRKREDDCLVLASDGLWDVMSNEEACEFARKRILLWHKRNGGVPLVNRGKGVDPAAQAAAEYLLHAALQKGTKDNVSVIVVDLKSHRKMKSKT